MSPNPLQSKVVCGSLGRNTSSQLTDAETIEHSLSKFVIANPKRLGPLLARYVIGAKEGPSGISSFRTWPQVLTALSQAAIHTKPMSLRFYFFPTANAGGHAISYLSSHGLSPSWAAVPIKTPLA